MSGLATPRAITELAEELEREGYTVELDPVRPVIPVGGGVGQAIGDLIVTVIAEDPLETAAAAIILAKLVEYARDVASIVKRFTDKEVTITGDDRIKRITVIDFD